MKKTIITIVVLAIISIGVYYYIVSNKNQNAYHEVQTNTPLPTPTPSASVSNVSGVPTAGVTVDIKNFAFNPATINIKTGTKVTWTNNDSAPHTVTSDSGSLLDSPTLAPGQSFSFTFTNTGTTNYHCAIHPMMKASVVVKN